MATSACVRCGTEFHTYPFRKSKFCSQACFHASRVGQPRPPYAKRPTGRPRGERSIVACAGCGTEMEILAVSVTLRKFCSHACYLMHRVGRYRRVPAVEMRTCLACGKQFEVGGRGRPPKNQVLCSDICQRQARYRRGATAKKLSMQDAIWFAGFLDGEGSIILYMRRDAVSMRLIASNTHLETVEHVKATCGVGEIVTTKHEAGSKWKTSYNWVVNSSAAESVLQQVVPYMRTRKPQAELALDFQSRLRDPALKVDRSWQLEYRARMQALNRRGPVPA